MHRKPFLVFICALLLICAPAFAEEWTALDDEIDIDYTTGVVRVFTMDDAYKGGNSKLDTQAMSMVMKYISALTAGDDAKRLSDLFATRKSLAAKVETVVANATYRQSLTRLKNKTATAYYTFDLKLLKSALPDINLPTPGDVK